MKIINQVKTAACDLTGMTEDQLEVSSKYIFNCAKDGFFNGLVAGTVVRAIPQLRIPVVLCSVGYGVYKYTQRTEKFEQDFYAVS